MSAPTWSLLQLSLRFSVPTNLWRHTIRLYSRRSVIHRSHLVRRGILIGRLLYGYGEVMYGSPGRRWEGPGQFPNLAVSGFVGLRRGVVGGEFGFCPAVFGRVWLVPSPSLDKEPGEAEEAEEGKGSDHWSCDPGSRLSNCIK